MGRLEDLDADVARVFRYLGPEPENWVPATRGVARDVVIVGAGQSGLATAFALKRKGVTNISVIDAAVPGKAGVWLNTARMPTLRTPKAVAGPELGVFALSFQNWHETLHGAAAYATVKKIPRTTWAHYLEWFRATVGIKVRNRTRLLDIEPADGHFRLHLIEDGVARTETARKVVLATGIAGCGAANIPRLLQDGLPASRYAHTSHPIQFDQFAGKVVAVLGSAASALDAAAAAVEAGASAVHMFCRRRELTGTWPGQARSYPGAWDNYPQVPDADRWRLERRIRQSGSQPPREAVVRAAQLRNFHLHLGTPWTSVREADGQVLITTPEENFVADFVIAGTGFRVDPAARPELHRVAEQIALWRDRYTPPPEDEDAALGAYPYLGPGFQFQEKAAGRAPYLKDLHCFTSGANLSFGRLIGDIPSLDGNVPRLAAAIIHDLFVADYAHHWRRMAAEVKPDFLEEDYAAAIWRGALAVAS